MADTYLPPADPLTRRRLAASRNSLQDMMTSKTQTADPLARGSKSLIFQNREKVFAQSRGSMVANGLHRTPTGMNGSKNASWDKPPSKTQPVKLTNIFLKKMAEENNLEECKDMRAEKTYLPPADPLTRRQKSKSFQKKNNRFCTVSGNYGCWRCAQKTYECECKQKCLVG
mmetsp:Transcript_26975/g.40831  ORF Transcript_26975/g.40831 Transcript_26975/m.40831 type:complete len:171 (-) Transcript_26975:428-940(-)